MEELISEHLAVWTEAQIVKTTGGRGRKKSGDLRSYGIKKLRELILELAVRGKLVAQDPADEPASVLLERIAGEKASLLKAGKIKKQKALPPITEEKKPFDLPDGWEWSNLSELLAIVTDGDHQAPPKSDSGIPFLVIGNLNSGKIIYENCKYVPEEYYQNLAWSRKPTQGDLLYTVTGSYGIQVPVKSDKCFCVQRHVAIFKSTVSTPRNYLSLVLSSKYAFDYATYIATGIAQKTVPLTGLRKMSIPLPPAAERHKIVAKVDELMSLCDRLEKQQDDRAATQQALLTTLLDALTNSADHAEFSATWQRIAEHFDILFTTEQSIDQLKQTILQLAVMGKLVSFGDDAAEFLLKELLDFGPKNGFSPRSVEYKTNFKVLKLGATSYGSLNTDESKFIDEDISDNSHLLLKKGDILIQRGNSAKFVGSNIFIRQNYSNYIYPDLMMKIRANDRVDPEFLSIVLMAPISREFMWNAMTGTSGTMPKINKKIVESVPVLIPINRKIQRDVVTKINELMTLCDTLKSRLQQAHTTQVQLADALVAQAVA